MLREQLVVISATPERPSGLGLFRHEGGVAEFTVFGVAGEMPPVEYAEAVDFVSGWVPAHVVAALRATGPAPSESSRGAVFRYPRSHWWRFERAVNLPGGLVGIGDAISSLNPTYGQGMTVAALQATELARCLDCEPMDLPARFHAAAAGHVEACWNANLQTEALVTGSLARTAKGRIIARAADRFLAAAETDAAVSERFMRINSQLESPQNVAHPVTLIHVATEPLRRRMRGGPQQQAIEPPPMIRDVRRRSVFARGVRFHVTESGSGSPVLALHGWPQHHYEYRDLLAWPPEGMRIIAPDLPGFGWSGPAPHDWAKSEVAADLLALVDALDLDRVLIVGHDWGGWIGQLMALERPEQVTGMLAVNIAHLWQSARSLPALTRLALYQPAIAAFGQPLHRHTPLVRAVFARERRLPGFGTRTSIVYEQRFRDPVCAYAATAAYRTWVTREFPAMARHPETRRAIVPIRALFGLDDPVLSVRLAEPATAHAEDYRLEQVPGCGHFLPEERPDLLRARLAEIVGLVSPEMETSCSTSS